MADENANTTDSHIVNPEDPTKAMANPDYVKPEPPAEPAAAKGALSLESTEPTNEIKVGSTGNKDVDGVGQLLAKNNIANADAIIKEYSETGDVSLANKAVILEALGDSVGELALNQLATVATTVNEKSKAARNEVLNYANDKFGGNDADKTWAEIQDYVKLPESGFSAEDRTAMTKMLKAGGLQARLVIDNIANVYAQDSNTTSPADLLSGDTLVQGNFDPITSKEYSVLVNEATTKFGYESTEVQKLQQRRERSRAQGIY